MSDFWKCPHCQRAQEKTDQLKIFAEAKRVNAVVFVNISSRAFPCRFCGGTVDIKELANGKFDALGGSDRQAFEAAYLGASMHAGGLTADSQSGKAGTARLVGSVIGGLIVGGLLGFLFCGILGAFMRLFTTANLPLWVVFVMVGVGAVGGAFIPFSGRE